MCCPLFTNCILGQFGDGDGGETPAGVYILPFISILVFIKKLPFLADFIKNWVHFIKDSDFLLKNDQIWPEIAISDHKKINDSK